MANLRSKAELLLSTTVTGDTVGGLKVGKVLAQAANEVSDQYLRGELDGIPAPDGVKLSDGYLSPVIRRRVADGEKEAEEFNAELLAKLNG
jgi:hypothetical protein